MRCGRRPQPVQKNPTLATSLQQKIASDGETAEDKKVCFLALKSGNTWADLCEEDDQAEDEASCSSVPCACEDDGIGGVSLPSALLEPVEMASDTEVARLSPVRAAEQAVPCSIDSMLLDLQSVIDQACRSVRALQQVPVAQHYLIYEDEEIPDGIAMVYDALGQHVVDVAAVASHNSQLPKIDTCVPLHAGEHCEVLQALDAEGKSLEVLRQSSKQLQGLPSGTEAEEAAAAPALVEPKAENAAAAPAAEEPMTEEATRITAAEKTVEAPAAAPASEDDDQCTRDCSLAEYPERCSSSSGEGFDFKYGESQTSPSSTLERVAETSYDVVSCDVSCAHSVAEDSCSMRSKGLAELDAEVVAVIKQRSALSDAALVSFRVESESECVRTKEQLARAK